MSRLTPQIQERIDAFVKELVDFVRSAALGTVTEALGRTGKRAPIARALPARTTSQGAPRPAGGKRAPEAIAETVRLLEGFVAANPGFGVEQIAKELGQPSRELVLPLKKLLAAGVVRTEGQKRATKYFPVGATESAPEPVRSRGQRKPVVAKGRGGRKPRR